MRLYIYMYLYICTGEMTGVPFLSKLRLLRGSKPERRKKTRISKRRREEARVKTRVYLFIYMRTLIVHWYLDNVLLKIKFNYPKFV